MTDLIDFNNSIREWGLLLNVTVKIAGKLPNSLDRLTTESAALARVLTTKYPAMDKTAIILIVLLTYGDISRQVFNTLLTTLPPHVGYEDIVNITNNCIDLRR